MLTSERTSIAATQASLCLQGWPKRTAAGLVTLSSITNVYMYTHTVVCRVAGCRINTACSPWPSSSAMPATGWFWLAILALSHTLCAKRALANFKDQSNMQVHSPVSFCSVERYAGKQQMRSSCPCDTCSSCSTSHVRIAFGPGFCCSARMYLSFSIVISAGGLLGRTQSHCTATVHDMGLMPQPLWPHKIISFTT